MLDVRATATPDTAPPVMNSLRRTPAGNGPFIAGDELTFDWDISDASDINYSYIRFTDALGRSHAVTAQDGHHTTQTLTDQWANGPVTVDYVYIADHFGNASHYTPAQHPDLNLDQLNFEVEGNPTDTDPPVLELAPPRPPPVTGHSSQGTN